MLKKEKDEQEESEIEEEIKEEEIKEIADSVEEIPNQIDDNEFVEFMQPFTSTSSPILKKVEDFPVLTNLEQDVAEAPVKEPKEEEPIKYETIKEDYESVIKQRNETMDRNLVVRRAEVTRIQPQQMDLHRNIEQEFEINPELQELRRSEGNLERDYVVHEQKIDKDNHKLPFERRDTKYQGRTFR